MKSITRSLRSRSTLSSLLLTSLIGFGLLTGPACSSDGDSNDGSGGTTGGGGGDGTGGRTTPIDPPSEEVSSFIVVDQFGYRPSAEKIAVLRDPQVGFDADQSYVPAGSYQLIDAASKEVVLEITPSIWNGGATHEQSGDKAWWLDFSSVKTPGTYYLLDPVGQGRSDLFRIADDVYREVLKHAMRSFFYQRAGFEKKAEFAGEAWADGASHVGPLQDKNARLYSSPNDASTERDLSGGWYDAGDYSKYSAWTGDYVSEMLRAYEERPAAFTDDYGIPESGNSVPDILDEARFGLEHLIRLQEESGGVLSIVSLDDDKGASPPSAAQGPSLYGPVSTNATIRVALAFSAGARIFKDIDATFANDLKARAEKAWDWISDNPNVTFRNNEGASEGVGAGQQEVSEAERTMYKLCLSVDLYRLTQTAKYKTFFETNYAQWSGDPAPYPIFESYIGSWHLRYHEYYLDYAALPDANETVKEAFLKRFTEAMSGTEHLGMLVGNPDPYLAHTVDDHYGWGATRNRSNSGLMFYSFVTYDLDASKKADASRAAERFVHFIHGLNPLNQVYLSNMGEYGAHKSVSQFYHTWFAPGTPWDEVGVSEHGPAPGFLVGGPNKNYNWDNCCATGSCASLCGSAPPAPPFGQPPAKSFKSFNDSWPLNSWEVTENSNGYQLAYIRLLSKFVD